ncbi:MAG: YtxH domain-containing protein [Bacteroidetes bacterium]|nr:YtxH domain-containing protein [Bacteroidota bacterium]
MSSGKVFLGVLAGVAAGAALGILFAPAKGSKTRRRITQKKDAYVDELEDKYNDLIGSITEKFNGLRGEASHMVKNGKHKIEEMEAEVVSSAKGKI